jgi:hypothetical protein
MKKKQVKETKKKPPQPRQPAKDQQQESEDIERAVYDGMQDLRTKKPGSP